MNGGFCPLHVHRLRLVERVVSGIGGNGRGDTEGPVSVPTTVTTTSAVTDT